MFKPLTFKDKTLIIPLIFSFVLLAIVFWIVLIIVNDNKKALTTTTVLPTPAVTRVSVEKVIPDEPQTLTGGIPHTFLIYFTTNISLTRYTYDLSYDDITQDNPQKITVPKTISLFAPNVVSVKTLDPIKERSEYYLTVTDPRTNITLSSSSYLSGDIQPTPIPTNNQILKQYLPQETDSYLLEYSGSKNLYIFHFKYNPNNQKDLTQQYNDAKSQAIQFIQSKGIDINSIVIQYRSS